MPVVLIGILLRMLGGLFIRIAPMLIGSVLKALAVSTVSFVGMKVAIDQIHNLVKANVNGLPSAALQMVALLKFDVAIEILFAAIAGRLALGVFNGVKKSFKLK